MTKLTIERNDKQRQEDWAADRLGKFTASQFYRLMTEPRSKADKEAGKLSQGAITYVMECVAEHLTGKAAKEEFDSKATAWGSEHEPLAKSIYEAVFDCKVDYSGFIEYTERVGGSPDGLVGGDGGVEFKCPFTIASHLTHLMLTDAASLKAEKPEYYWQCLGCMLITNRKWWDFVSYQPLFPAKHQLKRLHIARKDVIDDMVLLDEKLERAEQEFNSLLNLIQQ